MLATPGPHIVPFASFVSDIGWVYSKWVEGYLHNYVVGQ